jgi:sulfatase maturation enzyme AslB (radical SAM superfamily)
MALRDSIPKDKMFEIVEDLIQLDVKAVTFSGGGEPLIYPHIIPVLRKLSEAKISFAALTNGSFLNGEKALLFSQFGTWVRISMDGWDNESYVRFRSTKALEYDNIIRNIRDFKKLNGPCHLGVSFIVNDKNYEHIFEACEKLQDAGVEHIKVSGCVVHNDGAENNLYHAKIRNTVGEQIAKAQSLNGKNFQVVNHYHDMTLNFDKEYEFCPMASMLTVIGADSNIYTCQDKAYTELGRLGSIKDVSFKDFWFSENNVERLLNFNPKKECSHHCVANTKNIMLNEYLSIDQNHISFI